MVHTPTRQAEEGNNISRSPSPADLTINLPSTPVSVRSTLPVTNKPVSEGINTVKVWEVIQDLDPCVLIGPTQHPSKSALSADDIDANSVYSKGPTPELYSSDTGGNPQVSAVVPFLSPHPDVNQTIINLSAGAGPLPPPLSIPDSNHIFDASQYPTLATTLSRPPEDNSEEDIAAPWAESGISENSTTANPMPLFNLSGNSTSLKSEEVTVAPAVIFFDPQPSPILMPSIHGGETLVKVTSRADSASILSDHIPHTPGFPSKPLAMTLPYTPHWPSSVLNSPVISSKGDLSALGGTSAEECPIPMAVLSDERVIVGDSHIAT